MTTVINVPLANPNPESPESVRRAILILNMLSKQLQADDLVFPQLVYNATADEAITNGFAVYMKATGNIAKAKADGIGTAEVAGMSISSVAADGAATFITGGKLTLDDWTAVIGAALLTPGSAYYLSPTTGGALTTTAPTTPGQVVEQVGVAMSTTVLDVRIADAILL